MRQTAAQTEKMLLDLLKAWGDALLGLQVDMPASPELDGGILCPACKMIHGRCHEAAYPLLTLARLTGERKYVDAAVKVFRWGENMLCSDGSMRNDSKSGWRGTTVFAAVALRDALYHHGDLLTETEKTAWEERLRRTGVWLFENLRPGKTQAYINYYAANSCAMALLGKYFQKEEYLTLARELVAFCLAHTSESGLIFGEGRPLDVTTEKGCRAIDAGGYNVEETLPMLTRCAAALGDSVLLERCKELWRSHLIWMLPDGGWDDSAGSRAFKWTYWGSRTSDGCQEALFLLGREDPVFAEAALRNAGLYARCTRGGLLFGGRDYVKVGELPCVHHTFCHAKVVAGSLNAGLYDFERTPLPSETAKKTLRFPELDLIRISHGGWIADVVGYDHSRYPGDHASGGAVSLLKHKKTGPLIACGSADHKIREPLNQQLPSDAFLCRSACPRLEYTVDGIRYAQYYDLHARLDSTEDSDGVAVTAESCLCDGRGNCLPGGEFSVRYVFADDRFIICCRVAPSTADRAEFVVPLIDAGARLDVLRGSLRGEPERFFDPSPGFAGKEYAVRPDEDGVFVIAISV